VQSSELLLADLAGPFGVANHTIVVDVCQFHSGRHAIDDIRINYARIS
jgi:hypothetical protein